MALVALLLGAYATTADARKRVPTATTAKFKAELSGTQFAQTDAGEISDNNCQLPSGTSTERVEFQATTFRVQVTELPPSEIVLGTTGSIRIPVNGTVTRSNMGSAACQDDPKRPVDCGVVPIGTWHLQLQWQTRGFQLIVAGGPDSDPFSNCASRLLLDPFPELFGAADDEPKVVARASLRDLLDRPKKRTIVVQGHGTTSFRGDRSQGSVSLDWRMTLTRQKAKKPRRKR